ncbi:uncharacterized protein LOC123608014 [Leopardus geoffroyi]|uniref:uncharacterized protein LOC123608014 n=1 Tax=Leopardus geoffroyi TaxID=46844 RepID=UPI001E25EE13|nr:uncharacterized protein LOC123608014 [Leopardus geoffroyi]
MTNEYPSKRQENSRGEHAEERGPREDRGRGRNKAATRRGRLGATGSWKRQRSVLPQSLRRERGHADPSIWDLKPPEQWEKTFLLLQATKFVGSLAEQSLTCPSSWVCAWNRQPSPGRLNKTPRMSPQNSLGCLAVALPSFPPLKTARRVWRLHGERRMFSKWNHTGCLHSPGGFGRSRPRCTPAPALDNPTLRKGSQGCGAALFTAPKRSFPEAQGPLDALTSRPDHRSVPRGTSDLGTLRGYTSSCELRRPCSLERKGIMLSW